MHEVLSLILNTTEIGTKMAICHPSIWEVDTEGSETQGHPQQVSTVNASPGCRRLITERRTAAALGLKPPFLTNAKQPHPSERLLYKNCFLQARVVHLLCTLLFPTHRRMSLDITGAGRQTAFFIYRHRCDVDNF